MNDQSKNPIAQIDRPAPKVVGRKCVTSIDMTVEDVKRALRLQNMVAAWRAAGKPTRAARGGNNGGK